jgi:hypothetical protein
MLERDFTVPELKQFLMAECRIYGREHQRRFNASLAERNVNALIDECLVQYLTEHAAAAGYLPVQDINETLAEQFGRNDPIDSYSRIKNIVATTEERLSRLNTSALNENVTSGIKKPAPLDRLKKFASSVSSIKLNTAPTVAKNSIKPKVRLTPVKPMLSDGQVAHRAVARIANARAKGLKA